MQLNDEIFIMANDEADSRRIHQMNGESARQMMKSRMEFLANRGTVKEQDMPDVSAALVWEKFRISGERLAKAEPVELTDEEIQNIVEYSDDYEIGRSQKYYWTEAEGHRRYITCKSYYELCKYTEILSEARKFVKAAVSRPDVIPQIFVTKPLDNESAKNVDDIVKKFKMRFVDKECPACHGDGHIQLDEGVAAVTLCHKCEGDA